MDAVFLQYGALGAITVFLIFAVRAMYNKSVESLERERARADRLEKELLALHEAIRNDYTGTITRASLAINEATRAVADALAAVRKS